jgi:hypothetical protein
LTYQPLDRVDRFIDHLLFHPPFAINPDPLRNPLFYFDGVTTEDRTTTGTATWGTECDHHSIIGSTSTEYESKGSKQQAASSKLAAHSLQLADIRTVRFDTVIVSS